MRRILSLLALALLLSGCGSTARPAASTSQTAPASPAQTLTPVVVSSELVIGSNRFALGLLRGSTPVEHASVQLSFYRIEGEQAFKTETLEAPYYGYGLQGKGVYVAHPSFDRQGEWGLEVQASLPDGSQQTVRTRFSVQERGSVPRVGEAAISVATPTGTQVDELRKISSDPQPDPQLYQISLDQALKQGKPVVLIFATPGYCASAVCGPDLEVVKGLASSYGDQAHFIHVEVFKDPIKQVLAEPMVSWRLQTEPWLFLIDAQGTIRARYEGGITPQEVEPEFKQLLGLE